MDIKKLFLLLIGVLAVQFLMAEDSTKVVLELPKTLDFSTVAGFKQTVGLLISAVITLITGYWAKGNALLKRFLPTTEKRVAFVGFLVSVGVGLAFGFSGDTLTTIWTSLLGVFVGMGGYGTAKTGKAEDTIPEDKTVLVE